jgi:hypothetical protein
MCRRHGGCSVDYRGVNLYYRAEAVSDVTPHPSAKKERISAAAYQDLAALQTSQIHPVDRRILKMWRRQQDRETFYRKEARKPPA